ncbi:MAG: hypothetical protein QXO30_04850 [Candidatus Caldarchaeum sp.]
MSLLVQASTTLSFLHIPHCSASGSELSLLKFPPACREEYFAGVVATVDGGKPVPDELEHMNGSVICRPCHPEKASLLSCGAEVRDVGKLKPVFIAAGLYPAGSGRRIVVGARLQYRLDACSALSSSRETLLFGLLF